MRFPSLTCFVCLVLPEFVNGADWPQFRGPNGCATSEDKNLPVEWSKSRNIAWKVDVPGFGLSCPVISGDKIYVTTAISEKQKRPTSGFGGPGGPGGFGGGPGAYPKSGFGGGKPPDEVFKFEVHCLNAADGTRIWKQTAAEQKPTIPKFPSNSYATETPVVNGQRIYIYFGMVGLFCYDLEGKQIWKADIGSYPMAMGFGTGSSPVLADGKVTVQCDNEKESFLVAFDAKTGKEAWRTKRSEKTGWSTPFVWKTKNRTEIVCIGSQKARSYDPANGKQLWELGGMSGQAKASPVATEELLFVGTGGGGGFGGGGFGMGPGPGGPKGGGKGGFGGPGGARGSKPLFAVHAGASGDITLRGGAKSNQNVAWQLPQAGPGTASPLVYDGRLYILEERGGILTCLDAKSGKQIYKERIPRARGFTSSPFASDGKIYCLDDGGTTHLIQAGPEFKVLAANALDGMCWSSPAAIAGAIFVRSTEYVYCIREKK
jgi:outer membrane protein assembly factor BamB